MKPTYFLGRVVDGDDKVLDPGKFDKDATSCLYPIHHFWYAYIETWPYVNKTRFYSHTEIE
jgi:hypothetical protein